MDASLIEVAAAIAAGLAAMLLVAVEPGAMKRQVSRLLRRRDR